MHSTELVKELSDLFKAHFNQEPEHISILPQAGSDRRYMRLSADAQSVIGAFNEDKNENNTFFYFTKLFQKAKLPVPGVLAVAKDKQGYLLEDLGDESLFDIINKEGHTERVKVLLKKSIDQLVRLHWDAGRFVDYSCCFSSPVFDKNQILSDLLYFKYYFADLLKVNYNKPELLEELKTWSLNLSTIKPQTFMYRDFQSRNIMVKNNEVYFIDYQGGMEGLPQYDLASLLWQARAQFPEKWKKELLNYYFTALNKLPEVPNINETEFRKGYLECVLLRILQTLGAYGFRGLIERRDHFLKSIHPALKQLRDYLNEYPHLPVYNELGKLLTQLIKPEILNRFDPQHFSEENVKKLKVTIYSFSYKKGLPKDETLNGGGYIFDCRGLHNPGRYEPYKQLTGKDQEVIDFLLHESEIESFLKNVFGVVDISIENYLNRGFDSLSISFGCTGGQHRSVYAAEAMMKHLQAKYNLQPTIFHREQSQLNC